MNTGVVLKQKPQVVSQLAGQGNRRIEVQRPVVEGNINVFMRSGRSCATENMSYLSISVATRGQVIDKTFDLFQSLGSRTVLIIITINDFKGVTKLLVTQ